jgi:hypothetical protein
MAIQGMESRIALLATESLTREVVFARRVWTVARGTFQDSSISNANCDCWASTRECYSMIPEREQCIVVTRAIVFGSVDPVQRIRHQLWLTLSVCYPRQLQHERYIVNIESGWFDTWRSRDMSRVDQFLNGKSAGELSPEITFDRGWKSEKTTHSKSWSSQKYYLGDITLT